MPLPVLLKLAAVAKAAHTGAKSGVKEAAETERRRQADTAKSIDIQYSSINVCGSIRPDQITMLDGRRCEF